MEWYKSQAYAQLLDELIKIFIATDELSFWSGQVVFSRCF